MDFQRYGRCCVASTTETCNVRDRSRYPFRYKQRIPLAYTCRVPSSRLRVPEMRSRTSSLVEFRMFSTELDGGIINTGSMGWVFTNSVVFPFNSSDQPDNIYTQGLLWTLYIEWNLYPVHDKRFEVSYLQYNPFCQRGIKINPPKIGQVFVDRSAPTVAPKFSGTKLLLCEWK